MKKTAFMLLLGLAGMANVNAQQLPRLKDTVKSFGINPLFTDSLAKWPGYNNLSVNKQLLKTGELFYSNMPAVKAKGNYKMPVEDPATPGVNYTMMVKKIEFVKSVDSKLP